MPRRVEISVVVPAFNEERYIRNVLEGLRSQTFRDFEMIVVDRNSEDATREIAKEHGALVIIEPRKGIGLARNTGARQAKGKVIFFTNADTKPSRNLLKIYADLFDGDKKIVAASGPLLPLEGTTWFIRFGYWFASVCLAKLSFWLGMPAISGSNFAVRRSAFEKAGGFNEAFETYEDLDLSGRLKKLGKVVFIDEARVQTSVRRIKRWGLARYIVFNAGNVVSYNLFKRPKSNYEEVR
jgi:glycosyltransferase involved in cell wall biosynthesis